MLSELAITATEITSHSTDFRQFVEYGNLTGLDVGVPFNFSFSTSPDIVLGLDGRRRELLSLPYPQGTSHFLSTGTNDLPSP